MCSMSVVCPLCTQISFTNIDALRNSLIKAANGIACPICSELFLGLDKLTIHLFSHTNLMTHSAVEDAADVSKISNETKTSTISLQLPQHIRTINGDVMPKAPANETTVVEKKPKRCKQAKSSNIRKDIQKETISKSIENKHQPTAISTQQLQQQQQEQEQQSHLGEPTQLSTCDICEFTFRNAQLRDMHFRLVHQNSPQTTTMTTSNATSTNSPTVSTTNANNEPDFKCHLCAKTFKMKGSLRVHLKVVHMIGLNHGSASPKLGICDRIRYKEVKSHQNTKLNTAKTTSPLAQQMLVPAQTFHQPLNTMVLTNPPNTPDLQLGAITLLSTQQMGQISTENHMPTTNSLGEITQAGENGLLGSNVLLVFTQRKDETNKEPVNKSPAIDNPKIWECDVCSKSFTTKYFLKKHKRLHTGEMPYSCEICGRTFTFQQSYHKHLLYHSDEKPHICAICGRAFKELSTLHNHERIHSGEKPFKCEICGKCFRQRVSFLVHTRIHTGVMPYKCEQCGKSFRYKVSLRTHKCLPSVASQSEMVSAPPEPKSTAHSLEDNTNTYHTTDHFIKAFFENPNGNVNSSLSNQNEPQHSPASLEIAAITDSTCLEQEKIHPKSVEALLSKTIDDIVVESCNKMGIGNTENTMLSKSMSVAASHLSPSPSSSNGFGVQHFSDGSSSPLQKLQNMRLQSPKFDMQTADNEDIVQFHSLLFDRVSNDSH